MLRYVKIALIPLVLCAALQLAGCGQTDRQVAVIVIGKPESLNLSASNRSYAGQLLRGAIADGLVGLDEQGRVIPALADRWIVEDDGQSYIFRLRAGNWPDGSMITAASVQSALRQAIGALRGTAMALDLAAITEIRTMTGRVIELRLSHPQPELLTLLAQPELGFLRKNKGAGAMRLNRDGTAATLTPIEPEKRGLTAIKDWAERARKLRLRAVPVRQAISLFNSDKATTILGGSFADLPPAATPDLPQGSIQFDPVQGMFGLAAAHNDGFLSQAANREAIAMAIDRDRLLENFAITDWHASTLPLPAGVHGASGTTTERWNDQTLVQRRSVAAARVAKWRSSKVGSGTLQLRIALPAGTGADMLFARLSDDLKQIGLATVRTGPGDAADLRFVDAVASYPRAAWYFNQFSCANHRWLCSSDVDKLIAAATAAPDAAARTELMTQAEVRLTEANIFIPFGSPVRWSMVRSGTTGFTVNSLGYHPLMPLALLPK
jgi:ABC-type transport system substrate-binding protein